MIHYDYFTLRFYYEIPEEIKISNLVLWVATAMFIDTIQMVDYFNKERLQILRVY